MTYRYRLLDPRPAARDAELEWLRAHPDTLGVEVTVPELAAACGLGNIDPQHLGGDHTRAAIQDAMVHPLPPDGAWLVTIRPDLDAFGAMAVLDWRCLYRPEVQAGQSDSVLAAWRETWWELQRRANLIARADTFAHGPWPGPQSLVDEPGELDAIGAAVADRLLTVKRRVDLVTYWLIGSTFMTGLPRYEQQVADDRAAMHAALDSGEIQVRTQVVPSDDDSVGADATVVEVVSTHRAGTSVGYRVAPVVVALNPQFPHPDGPGPKYTICQYETRWVDLLAVFADLSEREPGWGGSPTIGGSPQGVPSTLDIQEVTAVVGRHLTRRIYSDGLVGGHVRP